MTLLRNYALYVTIVYYQLIQYSVSYIYLLVNTFPKPDGYEVGGKLLWLQLAGNFVVGFPFCKNQVIILFPKLLSLEMENLIQLTSHRKLHCKKLQQFSKLNKIVVISSILGRILFCACLRILFWLQFVIRLNFNLNNILSYF